MDEPTVSNGSNGECRRPNGQFDRHNRYASGNPQARRSYELRRALLDATAPEDLRAVWAKVAELARWLNAALDPSWHRPADFTFPPFPGHQRRRRS